VFNKKGRLCQRPVREIETLWQDTVRHDRVTICEETSLPGVQGRLLDLTVTLQAENSACRRFTLHVAKDESHYVEIRCNLARGELVFDRSHGGSHRDIVHTRHVIADVKDGKLALRLLMDKESVELFINGGERAVTSLIPTPMEADQITFSADAPVSLSVEAHHLK
jgi:beta-fructofuranosidase